MLSDILSTEFDLLDGHSKKSILDLRDINELFNEKFYSSLFDPDFIL